MLYEVITVLILESMYHPDGEALLASHVDIRQLRDPTPATTREAARSVDGVFVRYPCKLRVITSYSIHYTKLYE